MRILNGTELQRLARTLSRLPQWGGTTEGRRKFLRALLMDTPKADQILGTLVLEGAPDDIAEGTLLHLLDAGEVVPGHHALEFFLRSLVERVTDSSQEEELCILLERLQQMPPTRKRHLNAGDWRGEDDPADRSAVQEKVIGENTLRHVVVLALGLKASEAVCRVRGPLGMGTGFLVARNLLLTNNHVIDRADRLPECDFEFRYQLDQDDHPLELVTARALQDSPFVTDIDLDFTLITLNPESADRVAKHAQPLAIRRQLMNAGDRVAIIQHPGGNYKQISFQNNKVQYGDKRIVQYTTTTESGSSGSPVFNERYDVVAIHTSGGRLQQPDDRTFYYRNQGTSMLAITDLLRNKHPEFYAALTIRESGNPAGQG